MPSLCENARFVEGRSRRVCLCFCRAARAFIIKNGFRALEHTKIIDFQSWRICFAFEKSECVRVACSLQPRSTFLGSIWNRIWTAFSDLSSWDAKSTISPRRDKTQLIFGRRIAINHSEKLLNRFSLSFTIAPMPVAILYIWICATKSRIRLRIHVTRKKEQQLQNHYNFSWYGAICVGSYDTRGASLFAVSPHVDLLARLHRHRDAWIDAIAKWK